MSIKNGTLREREREREREDNQDKQEQLGVHKEWNIERDRQRCTMFRWIYKSC